MCETSASISFELEVRMGLGDYVFKNMKYNVYENYKYYRFNELYLRVFIYLIIILPV